jgi:type IV pilus assembly protein PilM
MKKLYSRDFPTPSYLAMNSCALDISDQSIKYGEIKATPSGLKLGRYGKEKIPPGVVVSGKIEDQIKLVSILKDLRKRLDLHFVRASLPEEQMYLFTLSLPKTAGGSLREMIMLQIEEHIPLKAVDTVFDYDVISMTEKGLFVEVAAIAATTIETYLSVFKEAGLSPLSFELEAQAISRAVVPYDDNEPIMVVDFGDTRTGVSVTYNRKVFFTTTLDIGGTDITKMIAKNFNIPFEKAEEMKVSYGKDGISNEKEDMFSVILNGVSVLRDEINKHYVYWKTHDNDDGIEHKDISRIILCGGDSNLSGLASYLEASMMKKVEYANAWVNISNMEDSVPDMSFEESLGYVTVLGIALGDYVHGARTILNVLPKSEKASIKKEYWMRIANVSLSLFALIGLISTALLLPLYFFSTTKESLAESRLEDFNRENPEVITKSADHLINDINSKLVILDKSNQSYQVNDRILGSILNNRPSGITFSQILYDKKGEGKSTLEVRGISKDRTTLRNFKSLLDANEDYTKVDLPISDFIEPYDINFTISITLK